MALALAVFSMGAGRADSTDAPVPQITLHVEVVSTTAGDLAKAGVSFEYAPFSVMGNLPLNPGADTSKGLGSLATLRGSAGAHLLDYLHAHGKVVWKPTITTFSGVPTSMTVSEPIKGQVSEGFSSVVLYTNALRSQIEMTPHMQQDGSIQLGLSLGLIGGVKRSGTTQVYQETLKTDIQVASGETFALGGLASSEDYAPPGIPLLTPGLTKDGGFGALDPKTPVVFVFVTASP